MGSGWVQLSPQQEVSNFKKLWLLAQVLGSFKTTPDRGGPEGERCSELQHLRMESWGGQHQSTGSAFPRLKHLPCAKGFPFYLQREGVSASVYKCSI